MKRLQICFLSLLLTLPYTMLYKHRSLGSSRCFYYHLTSTLFKVSFFPFLTGQPHHSSWSSWSFCPVTDIIKSLKTILQSCPSTFNIFIITLMIVSQLLNFCPKLSCYNLFIQLSDFQMEPVLFLNFFNTLKNNITNQQPMLANPFFPNITFTFFTIFLSDF